MQSLRLLLLATLVSVLGCADDDPALPAAAPAQNQWYAGDFHVHTSVGSNDTRGPDGSVESFPETIRQVAQERGMSFVVITDHSNSTGSNVETTAEDAELWNLGPEFPVWDTAAALSSDGFLMVVGSEISPVSTLTASECPNCPTRGTGLLTPVGHIGCVPIDLRTFDRGGAFIDRPPGQVSGGSAVEQCRARGGWVIINHPFYRSTPWIDYDWTSYDYDAIEVFNGSAGFTSFDRAAYDAYLCDRLAGRNVVAIGGSDNHRTLLPYDDPITLALGPPLGMPMTSIWAARLDWDDLMPALRRGRIVIHDRNTFVDMYLQDGQGARLAGIGDRVATGAGAMRVHFSGRSPRRQELRLLHAAPGSCSERRQPGRDFPPAVASTVVYTTSVCDGPMACTFEFDVELPAAPGLYFATVGEFATATLNVRDVAVTNAIEVTSLTP